MTESGHQVEVSSSTEAVDEEPDESRVADWLTNALTNLDSAPAEVSVRIVAADEMAALNAQYRGRTGPTNVLSFPSGLKAGDRVFLGDIVVCNEVVAEEASRYGQSCTGRFAHMMIHGLLHLLGHDHHEDGEREEMETMEKKLLAGFGISDPYKVYLQDATPDE